MNRKQQLINNLRTGTKRKEEIGVLQYILRNNSSFISKNDNRQLESIVAERECIMLLFRSESPK